jgi:hypothetical protein
MEAGGGADAGGAEVGVDVALVIQLPDASRFFWDVV